MKTTQGQEPVVNPSTVFLDDGTRLFEQPASQAATQSTSTTTSTARFLRSTLRNDLFRIIKKEMEETEDWVSLAGALGACDIHPFRATNEQISSVAREIEKDERLLKAFYHMPQKPVFKKESPEFKNKVEELLRTEDPNTRMDIMVNLLIDVRE